MTPIPASWKRSMRCIRSSGDPALLVGAMVIYTVFLVWQSRRQSASADAEFEGEVDLNSTWDRHWSVQLGLILLGLVALVTGSHFLVEAAVTTAGTAKPKAQGQVMISTAADILTAKRTSPPVFHNQKAKAEKLRICTKGE